MWIFSEIIYSSKLEKNGEALGQENISQVDKMNYNETTQVLGLLARYIRVKSLSYMYRSLC